MIDPDTGLRHEEPKPPKKWHWFIYGFATAIALMWLALQIPWWLSNLQ